MTEDIRTAAAGIPRVQPPKTKTPLREGPVKALESALETETGVDGFLDGASFALVAYSDKVTERIGTEAIRIAGRRRASAVDSPDVAAADAKLYPPSDGRNSPWKWGVLGIVAGAALSLLITILAPKIPDAHQGVVVTLGVVAIVGCCIWAGFLVLPRKQKTND
ncbi:hypothetical protein QNO00_15020 [Arthrobacter sp. zg-Y1219]|uniref:hypothetical protein n=1 Tax=Arthrobacter sp. zg-Y1219 TaxID=3049067 RepID=UPI0024C436A8|nr:hypothetical protein [Arthrobacter sp. zg-Y1219]MDK1361567.1 hypothetical protein [Arthrobacter sp. zg-Y1219]